MNLSFRSIQILFLVGVIALTVIDAKRLGQPGRNAVVVEEAEAAAATTAATVDTRQLQPGEPNYGLTPSEHQTLYGYMDEAGWYGNEYYDGGNYARGKYGDPWGNPMFYASNPQLNQGGGRGGGRGNWNNGRGNGRGNNGRGNVYYEEEQYAYGPNGGYYEEEQYYGGRNGGGYYQQDYYSNNGRGQNNYGYAAGRGANGGYAYGGYGAQGGYAAYGYGNNNNYYYNQGW